MFALAEEHDGMGVWVWCARTRAHSCLGRARVGGGEGVRGVAELWVMMLGCECRVCEREEIEKRPGARLARDRAEHARTYTYTCGTTLTQP